MAVKEIEFIIKPDGTVEERPLQGFAGNECHAETQAVEQALGRVQSSEPTEAAYRSDTVRQNVKR